MPDHMEQIQQCRGYYERKAKHTPLDGTEAWALETLGMHRAAETIRLTTPEEKAARGALRNATSRLHRHLFGEVE